MQAAILSTGTELTRGELVNGNAAWLSDRMTALGLEVVEHAVVPDDSARIISTLARLGREVQVVMCTGGLGPTSDDLTVQCVATLLGVPLTRHAHTLERIRDRYQRFRRARGDSSLQGSSQGSLQGASQGSLQGSSQESRDGAFHLPASIEKQADVPVGAQVLDNDAGTAPGFAIQIGGARCYFFPGVPREMMHLFERYAVPELEPRVQRTRVQRHIRVFGLGESQVAERLADFEAGGALQQAAITLGYRAHFPEVEVKILAQAGDEAEAAALADAVADQARARLQPYAYGDRNSSYPAFVGEQLRARKLKLALAESCTGGLVAKLLTDVPGSSDFFQLSVVTYADAAKRELLGVDPRLIEQHGAVSSEVAAAMAEGVLARSRTSSGPGADIAVAITGIAGPSGGSEAKPVGTVWFGVARRDQPTFTERRFWPGPRDAVRTWSAYCALQLVLQSIRAAA